MGSFLWNVDDILTVDSNIKLPFSKEELIVCVFSYNRPQYFKRVLDQIKANDRGYNYIFIQDFPCTEADVNDCVICANYINDIDLKNKVMLSPTKNLCIGITTTEAYRIIFENSDIDFCLFMQDDILISSKYVETINILRKQFVDVESIFSVKAYNSIEFSTEEETNNNINKYCLSRGVVHQYGVGIWKSRWMRMKKTYDMYYDYMKNIKYRERERDNDIIRNIFKKMALKYGKNLDFSSEGTAEDSAICVCLKLEEMNELSTAVSRGTCIGEDGLHFRSDLYSSLIWKKWEDGVYLEKISRFEVPDKFFPLS